MADRPEDGYWYPRPEMRMSKQPPSPAVPAQEPNATCPFCGINLGVTDRQLMSGPDIECPNDLCPEPPQPAPSEALHATPLAPITEGAGLPPVGETALSYGELMQRYLEVLPYRGLFDTLKANSERELSALRARVADLAAELDSVLSLSNAKTEEVLRLRAQVTALARERDAAHAWAREQSMEEREQRTRAEQAEQRAAELEASIPIHRAEAHGHGQMEGRADALREAAQMVREFAGPPLIEPTRRLHKLADQLEQRTAAQGDDK